MPLNAQPFMSVGIAAVSVYLYKCDLEGLYRTLWFYICHVTFKC